MYVIYTPESRVFLRAVIPTSTGPWLEWDHIIHQTGILPAMDDAIAMAEEVQQLRASENIFHYSAQVLRLGPDNLPDFINPAFDIPSRRRIS